MYALLTAIFHASISLAINYDTRGARIPLRQRAARSGEIDICNALNNSSQCFSRLLQTILLAQCALTLTMRLLLYTAIIPLFATMAVKTYTHSRALAAVSCRSHY